MVRMEEDEVDLEGGRRGGAMELRSGGDWRKKEREEEEEEAGWVGLY